jgi:serine/threonine protein kinase
MRKGGSLVALLVASNCVYRFTLSKPNNSAFGFIKTIEKAEDVATMEWVLSNYLDDYIRDFHDDSLRSMNSKTELVDPFDWAPLNFGNSNWIPVSHAYNFGFLFKTTNDEVIRVQRQYKELGWFFGELTPLSPGAKVVVKYTSAIFDVDFDSGVDSIQSILRFAAVTKSKPKHPYLAVLQHDLSTLIVMQDSGTPLSDLMQSPQFRQRWAESQTLRRAFFSQVGLSALNLVDGLGLCHNDIRPPNIAFDGDSFCLIDFDFSRTRTATNEESAFTPLLPSRWEMLSNKEPKSMCFTVAQIVLTVFMLDGPKVFGIGEVTAAVSIWRGERDASEIDAEFERWVRVRGGLLLDFILAMRDVAPWPPALATDYKKYFTDVLSDMLD